MKLTVVGAGSIGFTRTLIGDILTVPELRSFDITFYDISAHNLELVTKVVQADIDHNGIDKKIVSTTDRAAALTDADYVINCVRVGGLEAFATDVEIPLKYGVDQCVGDTLCAGGIMYGQRGIAAMKDICADIKQYAKPDVLMLNYANPNAMITWACNEFFGVRTIGLCHGVQGGHEQIAKCLGLPKDEVDIICAGINHQTWYVSVKHKGEELTGKLYDVLVNDADMQRDEKVRLDIMKHFGYYSTESNGHLSEYVPWYRKRRDAIEGWISRTSWINGETGGYLRICREGRESFEKEWENITPRDYTEANRTHEHGSHIIEGLITGRVYRGHFNVRNNGCITNLPDDAIIEAPGYADGNGISMPIVGDLPLGCAAVCNVSISVQRLAVRAAVTGDRVLLRQAMLLDPLVGAVCNPQEVYDMTEEMLNANKALLPQYFN